MTRKRRYILTNFPGGGPPDPPMRRCALTYPPFAASWLGAAMSWGRRPAPPTLHRSPPTLKVADNPARLHLRWYFHGSSYRWSLFCKFFGTPRQFCSTHHISSRAQCNFTLGCYLSRDKHFQGWYGHIHRTHFCCFPFIFWTSVTSFRQGILLFSSKYSPFFELTTPFYQSPFALFRWAWTSVPAL